MIEFVLFHLQCNERVTAFQRVEIFVFVFAQPVEKMTAKTKINNEKKRDVGVCSASFEIVILNIGNCLKMPQPVRPELQLYRSLSSQSLINTLDFNRASS